MALNGKSLMLSSCHLSSAFVSILTKPWDGRSEHQGCVCCCGGVGAHGIGLGFETSTTT